MPGRPIKSAIAYCTWLTFGSFVYRILREKNRSNDRKGHMRHHYTIQHLYSIHLLDVFLIYLVTHIMLFLKRTKDW